MGAAAVPIATTVVGAVANKALNKGTSGGGQTVKQSTTPITMVFPSGRKMTVYAKGGTTTSSGPKQTFGGTLGNAIQGGADMFTSNWLADKAQKENLALINAASGKDSFNPQDPNTYK